MRHETVSVIPQKACMAAGSLEPQSRLSLHTTLAPMLTIAVHLQGPQDTITVQAASPGLGRLFQGK